MTRIKRLVNLATLRPNPDAGQTEHLVSGRTEEIRDDEGVLIGSSRPIERVYHRPEPAYLYEYEPLRVRCTNCRTDVDYDVLETDVYDGPEGEDVPLSDICPNCGQPDCTGDEYNITYEPVTEALERQKKEMS